MRHILSLTCALCLLASAPARAAPLNLYAAASLKEVLDEVASVWSGPDLRIVYGGSSTIARQVARGAPADLVITASSDWMDWLQAQDALRAETRSDLLANRLVLIGPAGAIPAALDDSLPFRLGQGPLAMALTEAVPAGQYGRAALEHLGLWEPLAPFVVQAANVRAALALVALGEAPLGMVYATDAAVEPRVMTLADVPEASHPPIRYPMALTATAQDGATALQAFLTSDEARAIFSKAGFIPLPEAR